MRDRRSIQCAAQVAVIVVIASMFLAEPRAQISTKPSLTGAWTLNKDLSDQPSARGERGEPGERGRRGGGGFGPGGMGRGGFGGGGRMGGRGGAGGRGGVNPEDMARMRDALRDITDASDHLTITETESMVVITSKDGRTTRLSPDGKKIKDDSTKIERKTKWDGSRLVSEISGAGAGKITQTFAVDPDSHQLKISVHMEGGGRQPRTIAHIYDRDQINPD